MGEPAWQRFEREVAEVLSLDRTVSSGNKWHDPGDGVSNGRRHPFPLLLECKHTEHSSRSVKLRELDKLTAAAGEQGKRALLALRFEPRGDIHAPYDYAVLPLHDLAELLSMIPGEPPRPQPVLTEAEVAVLKEVAAQVAPAAPRLEMLNLVARLEAMRA